MIKSITSVNRLSPLAPNANDKVIYNYKGNLYDSIELPNAGAISSENLFFSVAQGGAKSRSMTNLTQAGQLPAGTLFYPEFIQFALFGVTYTADGAGLDISVINQLQKLGNVEFIVSNKVYFEAPLSIMPVSYGLNVPHFAQTAAADALIPVNNGPKGTYKGYALGFDKVIQSNEDFKVRLVFDDTVTLTTGANTRLYVNLGGQWQRPLA